MNAIPMITRCWDGQRWGLELPAPIVQPPRDETIPLHNEWWLQWLYECGPTRAAQVFNREGPVPKPGYLAARMWTFGR